MIWLERKKNGKIERWNLRREIETKNNKLVVLIVMRGFDILVPLCLEFGFLFSINECLNRIRNEVVFKSESSITRRLETNETVLNLIPGESKEKNATPSGF